MSSHPLGPEVDAWPRPLPVRTQIAGVHVTLQPMHRRHADELFEAARGADESFAYMGYGPFGSGAEMANGLPPMRRCMTRFIGWRGRWRPGWRPAGCR